ncbi:MAG: Rubredoxin-NAD(+) reductase [candidate division BRC1 bacterium ADurb.BinA292]|nr:MAG: Rubredoxin-NAD(+) reductase [candidate division BRC1 bacterium ADurb.BinA292]
MESNQRIDWYRVKVAPDLLRELSAPNDLQGFLQAGGHVALAFATGLMAVLVYLNLSPWWLIPALLLHGTVVSTFGAASHELSHERVFRTGWLNRLFLNVVCFLTWDNPRLYMLSHNQHHKFTLHQPDDLEVVLPQKATLLKLILVNFLDLRVLGKRIVDNVGLALGRPRGTWYTQLIAGADAVTRRRVFNWSRLALLGHAAVLVVGALSGLWILPVVVALGRAYGGGLIMLMGLPQHIGLVDEVNDFRLSCRTYYLNPFLRFLYWRMNYHIEHHMYPAVPCYHLPRLHEAIKHELPHCPNGLIETWVQIADILIKQKYDPSYQFRARLPGEPETAPVQATQGGASDAGLAEVARVWECQLCGFIYDEHEGLPEEGFPPGTRWEDIPEDWVCPVCGVRKSQFKMVEIRREAAAAKPRIEIDSLADPIVIVGSGLAGYAVARELRALNSDAPIQIVTRDGGESYYKPSLSEAIAQRKNPDDLVQSSSEAMSRRLRADVLTRTTVSAIDVAARRLRIPGREIPYSKLVLALGAEPIRPRLAGPLAGEVLCINQLDDYRRFRERLAPQARVVILGAGLVGCEFANDLALGGYAPCVLDLADAPLARFLPPQLGQALKTALESIGVQWHFGEGLVSIEPGGDRPFRCTTHGNNTLEADLVLSAIGLRPNTELARAAGLAVNQGIQVDSLLRTSAEDVYAIGDCMEFDGAVRPFVLPIQHAAPSLARTLLGAPSPVDFSRVMPIVVKTSRCPVVIALPPGGAEGAWEIDGSDEDLEALLRDGAGRLRGFALLGRAVDKTDEYQALLDRQASALAPLAEAAAAGSGRG